MRNRSAPLRRAVAAAIALVGVSSSCRTWDSPATQVTEEPAAAAAGVHLRSETPTGYQLGIDQRAREIERSLGVR